MLQQRGYPSHALGLERALRRGRGHHLEGRAHQRQIRRHRHPLPCKPDRIGQRLSRAVATDRCRTQRQNVAGRQSASPAD